MRQLLITFRLYLWDGSRKCSAYRDLRYRPAIPEAQLVSFDHFAHELTSQLRRAHEQGATAIVITSAELCSSIRKVGHWRSLL
jgi:hypothetical protein